MQFIILNDKIASKSLKIGGFMMEPKINLMDARMSKKSNQIKSIKSNQIKSNQIKSNQIQIKSNQIKSNQIKSNQIKSNQIKSNQIKDKPKSKLNQIKFRGQSSILPCYLFGLKGTIKKYRPSYPQMRLFRSLVKKTTNKPIIPSFFSPRHEKFYLAINRTFIF